MNKYILVFVLLGIILVSAFSINQYQTKQKCNTLFSNIEKSSTALLTPEGYVNLRIVDYDFYKKCSEMLNKQKVSVPKIEIGSR